MNAADPSTVPRPAGWTADHEARWAIVFNRIVRVEGGYVNDPTDRGGATKYGVSLRFLAISGQIDLNGDHLADFDLDRDGHIDAMDVQLLTPANAEALYLRLFWIDTGYWQLPRPFDAALFDQGVNCGTGAAGKLLQRALNRYGPPPLTVDGQIGAMTIDRLNVRIRENGGAVLGVLRNEAASHYMDIIAAHPEQLRFKAGWLARARELGRV